MITGTTISINEARPHLSEVVAAAEREPITITKNGRAVALVVSPAEWSELQATLEVLGNQEMQRDIAEFEAAKREGPPPTYPHDEVMRQAGGRG